MAIERIHVGSESGGVGALHSAALFSDDPVGYLRSLTVDTFRALTPMPDEAQRLIDTAVTRVGLQRLRVVQDVMARGLVFNVPDWLGVMELYWESQSRAGGAKRTMSPGTRGERQNIDRLGQRLPVYCTVDDFSFNIRLLKAWQRYGTPLDTTMISEATRNFNEAVEDQALNGAPEINIGGYTVPGLLTAPNAATFNFVDNQSWTHSGHDGNDILRDIQAGITALHANNRYGPYHVWYPTTYGIKLTDDFKTNGDKSIMTRLKELDLGEGELTMSVADKMPADTIVIAQMTEDVLDVVVGQEPTAISWSDGPKWEFSWAVLGCIILRVKDDYDGNSGIAIGTPS
jgi:uncharacterized linocin/CFP29 family protein